MMRRSHVVLLLTLVVVTLGAAACSQQPGKEHAAFWDKLVEETPQIYYFTSYDALDSFKGDQLTLLIAGLRHRNEVARWFAAEKSIEFLGHKGAERIRQELKKLSRDSVEEVRSAVGLAENIYAGTYQANHRVRVAPDGKSAVVHRFFGAEYNDRKVWLLRDGKLAPIKQLDGSIVSVKYSPDSEWLAVAHAGRIWMGTTLIELASMRAIDILPWKYLLAQGYELDMSHPRPDPMVAPAEWSGTKLLLSYTYHDSNYDGLRGHVVYDISTQQYVKAHPPEPATDFIMTPQDWNK